MSICQILTNNQSQSPGKRKRMTISLRMCEHEADSSTYGFHNYTRWMHQLLQPRNMLTPMIVGPSRSSEYTTVIWILLLWHLWLDLTFLGVKKALEILDQTLVTSKNKRGSVGDEVEGFGSLCQWVWVHIRMWTFAVVPWSDIYLLSIWYTLLSHFLSISCWLSIQQIIHLFHCQKNRDVLMIMFPICILQMAYTLFIGGRRCDVSLFLYQYHSKLFISRV